MPQLKPDQILEFAHGVQENARPTAGFYALIFLASTIATFGLLANSAAVIIGAMLVAPLMSAIVAIALAVVLNRRVLLRRAVFALVTGAGVAWGTGVVLTWVSPIGDPGSEILSRTRPTLFDLWIALAAGIAGAYSLLRAPSSAALPGVAIATALVPPLVTAGIETRLFHLTAAAGALLLFVSNLVAIACGGMLVFIYYGLHRHASNQHGPQSARPFIAWSGALLIIALVLARSLTEVSDEMRMKKIVRETLRSQVRMVRGATVDRFDVVREGIGMKVTAVVATPSSIEPPMVAAAERLLTARLSRPVDLVVRSVITKDVNSERYLATERDGDLQAAANPVQEVERILREQAFAIGGGVLLDYSVSRRGDSYRVMAVYRAPQPVERVMIRGIQNLLSAALARPVELHLSQVLPEAGPAPIPPGSDTGDPAAPPTPAPE
ncbi:MAG: DUF389 domain-containing protein [Armatimonadota bacterium]